MTMSAQPDSPSLGVGHEQREKKSLGLHVVVCDKVSRLSRIERKLELRWTCRR